MNIRKNIDYSTMFDAMRVAMSADMSQTKLYYELGRLICQRTEKGAAVAAAEYLQRNSPDVPGLSPRNLRRMRDFYRMCEENLELLDLAMDIGWTQNVVILDADLNTEEQHWYLCVVRRRGWSKAELQRKIEAKAHQEVYLDEPKNQCYNNKNEQASEEDQAVTGFSQRTGTLQHAGNRQFGSPSCVTQVIHACNRLHRKSTPAAVLYRPPWQISLGTPEILTCADSIANIIGIKEDPRRMILTNTTKSNIVGRLSIFEIDCSFALLDGYSLKIIPNPEDVALFESKCKEIAHEFHSLGWIHGVDDWGWDVAFLLSEQQIPACYHDKTLTLISDVVLRTLNSKDIGGEYIHNYRDLKGFTAIDFTGNAVDAIFSPKLAIKTGHAANGRLEWLSPKEYTKSFSTILNAIECNLIFTVIVDRQFLSMDTTNLGKLYSVIRLEFSERQDIAMMETCWQAVCTLLTFCLGAQNITDTHVGLWDEAQLVGTAPSNAPITCKINTEKIEGVQYQHPSNYRFQVDYFGEKLGILFKLLNCEKTRPILYFLPETNTDTYVTRNKIRDLCTSLEVEFDYLGEKVTNQIVADLVDQLKKHVKDFRKNNPDLLEESTYTYIFSSLGHISLPAKEKLWCVYKRYATIIDHEIMQTMLSIDCTESQTREDIAWLVKLRNNITHSVGLTMSQIPNAIYSRLKLAVFCSILERAGYTLIEISNIMSKYFGR